MIVTKEQQEALVEIYKAEEWTTVDNIVGFVKGINATLKLVSDISKNTNNDKLTGELVIENKKLRDALETIKLYAIPTSQIEETAAKALEK